MDHVHDHSIRVLDNSKWDYDMPLWAMPLTRYSFNKD